MHSALLSEEQPIIISASY